MSGYDAILQHLSQELDCAFMSELHTSIFHEKAKKYFEWAAMHQFSLAEWQYAYHYVIGSPTNATTIDEIRIAFLKNL